MSDTPSSACERAGFAINPAFERALYEALLVAYGRILAKYNAFAQGSILRDVGKEVIAYLGRHGFPLDEQGNAEDMTRLTELFVQNGFVEKLDVEPAEAGDNFIWHNLYGRDAYQELHEISDNPFLACPLNLGLFYLAEKHGKSMKLHRKTFDPANNVVETQYEVVDQSAPSDGDVDPLVIENARLYQIAQERLDKLERAQKELRTLRGILPVCSCCRKIRDEQNEWHAMESYLSEHSDANFTHCYCPECEAKALRDIE
ncbi:hypothetical protein [Actomonas aquatica]|uniref:Uncharacterized protein n=1 Tax=Actomonas aquatica TaxID=2866162 RepID=A0ABZ1C326_9BACT|nr:hypothetical protein [Opitutus sp. WL0086]WRQ86005.1 hypothetical protein K1X11_014420 [Opitutus sp. WL0086]